MAGYQLSNATTSTLDSSIPAYVVESQALDYSESEYTVEFSQAAKNIGFYKSTPELKTAVDALATWSVGKGYRTSPLNTVRLNKITGWGEDSFQSIMENMLIMKKIVGDAFAEVIRNDKQTLVNLKPISPERMKIVVDDKGMIKHYQHKTRSGWKNLDKNKVFHISNDRLGDENHGISIIDALEWVMEAKKEALDTERKIRRRQLSLGILSVDTASTTERDTVISKYKDAIENGEILVLPKDVAEMKDSGVKFNSNLEWINYLDNYFYQVVGVPKVMVTSEGFTEAGGKVGFLTFEPRYAREQSQLEQDLWNQLAIKLTFNRPPSLMDNQKEAETKNTGQAGFQPKESYLNLERE